MIRQLRTASLFALLAVAAAGAQTQSVPGAGNATAIETAKNAPLIQSAYQFLIDQASQIQDRHLREQTHDALGNPQTCIEHRANLTPEEKHAILQQLLSAGLVNAKDDATFPGGLLAGVFPPVLDDGTACPHLPQPFWSAPGSDFGSHHSYPGGLAVHESNNEVSSLHLAEGYRQVYGQPGQPLFKMGAGSEAGPGATDVLALDQDIILGAPLWHDWAKTIVFQWNADGTEFKELSFGGNGLTDNNGQPGNSATGAHHILSIAETMKRGFPPAFVIAQASAHSAPTLGNEYKVVNWIRTAAIIDGVDPVKQGYLAKDNGGVLRLPALRHTGDAGTAPKFLAEYTIHNESDSDYTFSGPAVAAIEVVLAKLAPDFGYDPSDIARYNSRYRNVVLSNESAERLYMLYSAEGMKAVTKEVQRLKQQGKL